jgi:hypothetical protein
MIPAQMIRCSARSTRTTSTRTSRRCEPRHWCAWRCRWRRMSSSRTTPRRLGARVARCAYGCQCRADRPIPGGGPTGHAAAPGAQRHARAFPDHCGSKGSSRGAPGAISGTSVLLEPGQSTGGGVRCRTHSARHRSTTQPPRTPPGPPSPPFFDGLPTANLEERRFVVTLPNGSQQTVVTSDPGRRDHRDGRELGRFDVPTLFGIRHTAPYFHDNTARTLEDVIRHYQALFETLTFFANNGLFAPPVNTSPLCVGSAGAPPHAHVPFARAGH